MVLLSEVSLTVAFFQSALLPDVAPILLTLPRTLVVVTFSTLTPEYALDSLPDFYLVGTDSYLKGVLTVCCLLHTLFGNDRSYNDIIFIHYAYTSSIFDTASFVITITSYFNISYTFILPVNAVATPSIFLADFTTLSFFSFVIISALD